MGQLMYTIGRYIKQLEKIKEAIVNLLLDHGAHDTDYSPDDGGNIFHLAALNGNVGIVESFYKHHVDINCLSKSNNLDGCHYIMLLIMDD